LGTIRARIILERQSLEKSKVIIDQIKADMHNIQVMIDMLPECKKTRYNIIQNTIKQTMKDIRRQKEHISSKVWEKHFRHSPALFEVEPSEIEQVNIEDISSFFGILD